jgi:inner membrane protein
MASAPTHIVASTAVAVFFARPSVPRHLWLWAAVLAVLPDLDVIGFRVGVAYGDMLGHRGLSHSLLFAAVVSGAVVLFAYRTGAGALTPRQVWLFLFLATALHDVLDGFTNGGLGVAFFAPFTSERYFFPFRPLEVSPLSIQRFVSGNGLAILANEIRWVWLPSAVVVASVLGYRFVRRPTNVASRAA